MQPNEQTSQEEPEKTLEETEGTAPDSETQSSAASSRGTRETDDHKAPNMPAEGD